MTKNLGDVKRHRYTSQAGDVQLASIGHETRKNTVTNHRAPWRMAQARELRPSSSSICVRRLVFAGLAAVLAAVQVAMIGCGEIRSLTAEGPM